ncbi:hypothetical protein HF086_010282 [Spodoptera exigua]|uniref:Uncharacterized protein n=1 Tax=Spodoptera exigua TaxID=7107 RepID=A0A922SC29_SPOEX|nr:hypothetical protein HF086_010282 [Spodoptera exigua]
MSIKIIYCLLLIGVVSARHTVRYDELDDDDHHLLRAAYETPSYDHDEYQEQDDMSLGKLDLLKDGLWAIKAKIKEIKAFNKAMAANFLATKLKVKELLANSIALKKHHHPDKKPSYNYQAPSYQPQYSAPQYPTPAPQYSAPQYSAPQYSAPQYSAPQYSTPQFSVPQYSGPLHVEQQYTESHAPQYAEVQNAPAQHQHDPYYGH